MSEYPNRHEITKTNLETSKQEMNEVIQELLEMHRSGDVQHTDSRAIVLAKKLEVIAKFLPELTQSGFTVTTLLTQAENPNPPHEPIEEFTEVAVELDRGNEPVKTLFQETIATTKNPADLTEEKIAKFEKQIAEKIKNLGQKA